MRLTGIAGWTDKLRGDYFPADDGFVKLVRHEPLGYVIQYHIEPPTCLTLVKCMRRHKPFQRARRDINHESRALPRNGECHDPQTIRAEPARVACNRPSV